MLVTKTKQVAINNDVWFLILLQWCWLITYLICIQVNFKEIIVLKKIKLDVQTCTSRWK